MSEREDCGTPCDRWQFRLYSCEGCLLRLRDIKRAKPKIDTALSASTVIPSVSAIVPIDYQLA